MVIGQYCDGMPMRVETTADKTRCVLRPQDRKDAGPSLANIELRVHQLVKIPVQL